VSNEATRTLQVASLIFSIAIGIAVAIVGIYSYNVNERANDLVEQNDEQGGQIDQLLYQAEIESVADCVEAVVDQREAALEDILFETDRAERARRFAAFRAEGPIDRDVPVGTGPDECPRKPPRPDFDR
jgi:hypothetical protein